MEYRINQETGELTEIEEQNQVAEKRLYEVGAITEDTADFIEQYLTAVEQYEMFKHKLEQAMRENGIKSWKNDLFTATVTDDTTQKRVDSERMKEDGIYEKYQKLVSVKGGLRIKFKGK